MVAQLNIKDPLLIERARDLAKRRHQPVTATLRALVDREWEAEQADRVAFLADMRAWADAVHAELPDDVKCMTSKEVMDSIYDDDEPDGFAR